MAAKGDDKKNIIKLAYLYVQEGRWDNAVVEYQKLLELDPEDFNIHNMLGDVYARKNDSAKAYEEYGKVIAHLANHDQPDKIVLVNKKIVRLDPEKLSPEAREKQKFIRLYFDADQALSENRDQDAAAAYNAILKQEPDNLTVISKLAELEEKLGHKPEAIEMYARLGESFFKSHLFKKAQEIFKKVVAMDASNVAAHLNLAQIYIRQGSENDAKKEYLNIAEQALAKKDLDGAFEYANKAVELKSIEAHYIVGIVFFERQKWAEAKTEFEALLRFKVNHTGAIVYLAKVYDGMGQNDKAVETFQKALKSDKDNFAALEAWAEYCVKKKNNAEAMKSLTLVAEKALSSGDYKKAIQLAELMMTVDPVSVQPKLKLAGALEGSGDKTGAAEIYHNLALLCEKENKTEEAAQYDKKAVELDPHLKANKIAVKAAAVKAAEPVSAPAPVAAAPVPEPPKAVVVEVNPQEAFKAQLGVADLYVKQGLSDEAIEIYQQLLELEPENSEVKARLNNVYAALAKTGTDLSEVIEDDFEMKAREEAEKKAKEEAEKKAREEAEKKAKEEAEKKAREEAEKKIRLEAEKKAREEAEEKVKIEMENRIREETEKKVREELEKKAREEAEKKALEEAKKKQMEEVQRIARENIEKRDRAAAEKKAQEEAEKRAREEAERKIREEAEKRAREAAEKKEREEAEKKAAEDAKKRAKEEAEKQSLDEIQNKIREAIEKKTRELAEKRDREKEEMEMEMKVREEVERKVRQEMERKRREEVERKIREHVEKKVREEVEKRVAEEVDRQTKAELEKNYQEEEKKKAREEAKRKIREEMGKKAAELTDMVAVAEADLLCSQDRYEDAVKMYKGFLDTHPDHPEALKKLKMAEDVLKAKAAKLGVTKAPSYLKVIESPSSDSDDQKQSGKIGYV